MKSKSPPAPETVPVAPGMALRRYLYFTAGVTGAAIMIVEILGAKMLAPFFGLSHFVWTAQIAVTLVALACGYYAGGRLADRSQRLAQLYWAILIAAVYLALTVLICKPVCYWCLEFNLAVGSLMASAILFFVPLGLLAMTGPFLARVITSNLSRVGGNVGRLTAIGTVGSFGGTLFIGYLVLPLLPNSVTMYLTALLLLLISAGYLLVQLKSVPAVAALVLVAAGAGLGLGRMSETHATLVEKWRGNSYYGMLQVLDAPDGSRFYLNDNLFQNTYDPKNKRSESTFTYMLSGLARAYTSNITDVLCIGMGIGIVPMDFARQGAHVDVVEINPAVVPVAVQWFDFETNKVNLTIGDGRQFLNRCRKQYDVVVLDAFLGDSSPSHLLTREAFESIKRVLRSGGTLTVNCFADIEGRNDFFAASIHKTLKAVFPGVRLHHCGDGALFIAATPRADPAFVTQPVFEGIHPRARRDVATAMTETVSTDPEHGRVLTDDYNPLEYYDARNREDIRRRLALAAKDF